MYRYLLNISYIGTQFRGAQKQPVKESATNKNLTKETVQGVLETALLNLNPVNQPRICLSSRTDTGVHALQSTCHVDLESKNGKPYDPKDITIRVNTYMHQHQHEIRVLSALRVNSKFHARYMAVRRKYLYRVAVVKSENNISPVLAFTPIEESHRCLFITNPKFNIEKVRAAASLFIGQHDFRTFMGTGTKPKPEKNTRRVIESFEIVEGTPFVVQEQDNFPLKSIIQPVEYQYWDFVIIGKSFLYRQVRRTVGVLLAVAQGKLTCDDVKVMLQIPSKDSWNTCAVTLPPHGLYLCKVEYNPEDLQYTDSPTTTVKKKQVLKPALESIPTADAESEEK